MMSWQETLKACLIQTTLLEIVGITEQIPVIVYSDTPPEDNPGIISEFRNEYGPYKLTFFPRFFELDDEEQRKALKHEMAHFHKMIGRSRCPAGCGCLDCLISSSGMRM